MNKALLEKECKKRDRTLSMTLTKNNAYASEIRLRTKKVRHKLAMRKYRKEHPNFDKDYYRSHKKNCQHVAKIVFNEALSTCLVCAKCGCLIAKVNF